MSHGSEEGDNYWPGYVDALTSMVQVLAFVMMMLAMAVFVLSQSVSKSAVEAIAKAVKADVKPDASVKQLTQSVLDQLEKLRQSVTDPVTAPTPEQQSSTAPTTSAETDRPVGMRMGGERTQGEHPMPQVRPDAPHMTVAFADRSFRIEQDRAEQVTRFLTEHKVDAADAVVVNAYAFTGEGALSEARRLAYYRAMTTRKQLIAAKIAPDRIRINVLDTTDVTKGSTVEIAVAENARP